MEAHFPYCGWCSDVTLGKWSCTTRDHCPSSNWVAPTDTCQPLPTFYLTPQNKTLIEGATAQFRCGSHDSKVRWGKDGLALPRKAVYLNEDNIYIPEVRMEDTGYYECSVNNTSGVVVSRAYLYIQGYYSSIFRTFPRLHGHFKVYCYFQLCELNLSSYPVTCSTDPQPPLSSRKVPDRTIKPDRHVRSREPHSDLSC